jgi:hypothetical protein
MHNIIGILFGAFIALMFALAIGGGVMPWS